MQARPIHKGSLGAKILGAQNLQHKGRLDQVLHRGAERAWDGPDNMRVTIERKNLESIRNHQEITNGFSFFDRLIS